jgi:hypothetical protein
MSNQFKKGAKKAAGMANDITAKEQCQLKAPSWEGVKKMLPDPQDQKELDTLIKIVKEDTSHNNKVASLIQRIESVANVVIKTLEGLS